MHKISKKALNLYNMGVLKRSILIWILFQIILWTTFGIAYYYNIGVWSSEYGISQPVSTVDSLLKTFLIIIVNNLILFSLIALGNIFVRFGMFTPGILILIFQGIMIGWTAGTNSFEFPFTSVLEANIQYLKVGLWETTAYALICGVTLTKSLNIAATFPAKKWSSVRKLKDISFNVAEKTLAVVSVALLVLAAYIEAILITRL